MVQSLSKLKYLVVIDPLVTETSTFWQNHGESNDVDPTTIQTEVFRLPSTCLRKRMALSLTPVAGYSGTGKVRTRRAKRVTTARFWPVFTIVCVKCIAQKAVKAPNHY